MAIVVPFPLAGWGCPYGRAFGGEGLDSRLRGNDVMMVGMR